MNSFLYPHKSSQKQDEKEILRTTMEKLHVLKLRTKMLDCNGSLGFSCIDLMRPYQCLCYIKWKPILQQSWYSSSSSIQLFFMYVSLCLGIFWSILTRESTNRWIWTFPSSSSPSWLSRQSQNPTMTFHKSKLPFRQKKMIITFIPVRVLWMWKLARKSISRVSPKSHIESFRLSTPR